MPDECHYLGSEPGVRNVLCLEVHVERNVLGGIADHLDASFGWCRHAVAISDAPRVAREDRRINLLDPHSVAEPDLSQLEHRWSLPRVASPIAGSAPLAIVANRHVGDTYERPRKCRTCSFGSQPAGGFPPLPDQGAP